MKLNLKHLLIILTILFFSIGKSQKITPIQVNGEYFELPGKWEYQNQIKESGQFQLTNKKEKLNLLLSVRKTELFDFYDENLNEAELLHLFYKWDYDHWNSEEGIDANASEIKNQLAQNYMIWKISINELSLIDNESHTSYLLYAIKKIVL